MEWLKNALVARKQKELAEQWRQAGEALARLLQDDVALGAIHPEAAWTAINGVHTALRGMERALRQASRGELPAEARRALGDAVYALGTVTELLETYGMPAAEKMYGLPPPQTRWRMAPVEAGRSGP